MAVGMARRLRCNSLIVQVNALVLHKHAPSLYFAIAVLRWRCTMKLFRKDEPGGEEQDPTIPELLRRLAAAQLPPDAGAVAERELEMLSRVSPAAAEYTIGLTYLEYLAALPWHRTTEDNLDLSRAERILDEHHFGLGQVKERILEHLAIKALRRRRRPRVLAVDDDETARRNLVLALAREECEVVTAASSREALEQLEAREFDLLLTDLRLGQSDGMDLLERTRARWPDTRVVVITGYASIPSAVEAVKKGAFQYLAKPFAIEELRSIVRRALEGRALLKGTKGSVLCFAGPPGTGKTSVGRAIAQALGRTFSRISLGGIRDEADIRGHRRTYAGAKPGRVIEEIRRVESANPVLMLDELDKIGREVKGDPASALLEVLDPEQNRAFLDHYLDVPFDLSGVLFIVTVNLTDPVPEALLDRLEVIEFPGYTEQEKARIAARFLCPKQLREKGLGERPGDLHAGGDRHDHPRVHPGGGNPQSRAAHRHRLPQDRTTEPRRRCEVRGHRDPRAGRGLAREAVVSP